MGISFERSQLRCGCLTPWGFQPPRCSCLLCPSPSEVLETSGQATPTAGCFGSHRDHYLSRWHVQTPSFLTRTWHRKRSRPCGSRKEASKLDLCTTLSTIVSSICTLNIIIAHASSTLPQPRCFPVSKQEETKAKCQNPPNSFKLTKRSKPGQVAKPLNFWMTTAVKPAAEEPAPKEPRRDNKLNNLRKHLPANPPVRNLPSKATCRWEICSHNRWTKATRASKPTDQDHQTISNAPTLVNLRAMKLQAQNAISAQDCKLY